MILMMAAVVEPVSLQANWSEKGKTGGALRLARQTYCWTINFSSMRVRTSVMDIGR